jgi:hypothetical protein
MEDFCSSFWGHLQTLLYFPIVLDFRNFLSVDFIYSVLPLSCCDIKEEYFMAVVFILCFTLCLFETKMESIC